MATAWKVAAATAVVGWFVTPVIAFFLPKIISCFVVDPSEKLRQLKIHIMPELQSTLCAVDQARMLQRGEVSDVSTLDDMAAWLRHAREDAEDILDDAEEIDLYRNRCWQHLYGAVAATPGMVLRGLARLLQWTQRNNYLQCLYGTVEACIARCQGIARIDVQSGLARLLQWAQNWFKEPVQVNDASAPASHNHVGVTIDTGVSHEEAVSEATTSDSAPVPVTTPSCSSFDVFDNRCRSIFYWLVDAYEKVCILREWSYEEVGVTNNQENATALDFLVTAISRRSLKKRIEKVERTISDVKKSPLVGAASKIAPDDIANQNRSRIRTASNRKVFGREALRDSIMAKLRENPHGTSSCYSAIGIYGIAGSGKTSFARYIRDFIEEECKEEKLFNTVMCIHVSETFSVDDIFHEMLKDITKDRHSKILDREDMKEKLKKSLKGKRFFLILDDLWAKSRSDPQLEELISPLNAGLNGSKILVTSRTKVAAGALCADEPMEMPDLDEYQYLSMFMHYSLNGTNVVDEEFMRVGRVIAEKLHGSPIAAVVVAGQLGANRDIRFWKNIAEGDMLKGTMDALWWSYQQLSSDIKRCFEYCNIFPRRFEMKKEDLVHLWIAQGFVKTNCATKEMEDVAEGYIQELVSCSFLQSEITWEGEEFFRMHDLLHDLARMVTRTDCFRIENESSWKGDIPRDVRHLFIQNYDAQLITENKILGFVNLRTIIIYVVKDDTPVEEKVIQSICKRLPKLRVLAIAFNQKHDPIKKSNKFSVPESISQLKYLRYLAFRTHYSCMITLPSTLSNLQHIQLLDFGDGYISEFTFGELVNLRHIFCLPLVKLPYVGRLRSLQTLPNFTVNNEKGCELKQLRDLNKLRGKLKIGGLENVKSKGEAFEANLAAKRLTDLSLEWGCRDDKSCSPEVEADVLEGLCPPARLKKLEIWRFVGWRYPDWMLGKHNGGRMYLQRLQLWECSQPVPASGLAEAFPHLRVLELWWCWWDALPDNMERLTSLKELRIQSCKNIRSLPSLPQSLEDFTLIDCNDEFMKSCKTVGHPNWQKIEHIPDKDLSCPARRSILCWLTFQGVNR